MIVQKNIQNEKIKKKIKILLHFLKEDIMESNYKLLNIRRSVLYNKLRLYIKQDQDKKSILMSAITDSIHKAIQAKQLSILMFYKKLIYAFAHTQFIHFSILASLDNIINDFIYSSNINPFPYYNNKVYSIIINNQSLFNHSQIPEMDGQVVQQINLNQVINHSNDQQEEFKLNGNNDTFHNDNNNNNKDNNNNNNNNNTTNNEINMIYPTMNIDQQYEYRNEEQRLEELFSYIYPSEQDICNQLSELEHIVFMMSMAVMKTHKAKLICTVYGSYMMGFQLSKTSDIDVSLTIQPILSDGSQNINAKINNFQESNQHNLSQSNTSNQSNQEKPKDLENQELECLQIIQGKDIIKPAQSHEQIKQTQKQSQNQQQQKNINISSTQQIQLNQECQYLTQQDNTQMQRNTNEVKLQYRLQPIQKQQFQQQTKIQIKPKPLQFNPKQYPNNNNIHFTQESLTEIQQKRDFLHNLEKQFTSNEQEYEVFSFINANVPGFQIRKQSVYNKDYTVKVDVTINNEVGIASTSLLKIYSSLTPKVKQLVCLFKYYIQTKRISQDKSLNSLAQTILVVHFLKSKYLPNVQEYFRQNNETNTQNYLLLQSVNEQEIKTKLLKENKLEKINNTSLFILFKELIIFLYELTNSQKCDYPRIISLLEPKPQINNEQYYKNYPFIIKEYYTDDHSIQPNFLFDFNYFKYNIDKTYHFLQSYNKSTQSNILINQIFSFDTQIDIDKKNKLSLIQEFNLDIDDFDQDDGHHNNYEDNSY